MSGTRKRAKAVRPRRAGRARRGARGGFAADELKADIQRKVATGEMPPGSRILSARDLAKAYSVSYATCHKALCELEAEGLLVRQQGRGSFVADPAAEGEISLRVSLLDTDRPRAVEAIDDFGSERPRLKVLTCRGRSPLGPADVRQMMSFEATAEADHLVPLDGFAAEIIASGELDPAATAMFTVGGALRAVPGYFAPLVFYANARVFERAGVDVPGEGWTFAEMIETSAQLEAALAPKASGVLFPRLYFLMPVFWSHGVDAGAGARWGLDSPGAHRALEIVREWRRSTSFPIGDNGVDKITRLVATGRLAVAPWNGAMAQPLLEKLGDDLVILPYPAGPRGSATILTGEGLGISTGCRQPEVAWELLKRLTEADALDVAEGGTRLAARYSLRAADRIDEAIAASVPAARVVKAACDRELFGLVRQMIEEFVETDEPAADFAVRAGSVADALLAARRPGAPGGGEGVG